MRTYRSPGKGSLTRGLWAVPYSRTIEKSHPRWGDKIPTLHGWKPLLQSVYVIQCLECQVTDRQTGNHSHHMLSKDSNMSDSGGSQQVSTVCPLSPQQSNKAQRTVFYTSGVAGVQKPGSGLLSHSAGRDGSHTLACQHPPFLLTGVRTPA